MKKEKDSVGLRRLTITFLKDPLTIHKEVRIRANYHIKKNMSKRAAYNLATNEIDDVQNTQVLLMQESLDLDPISDLVFDLVGDTRRLYKFTTELIR